MTDITTVPEVQPTLKPAAELADRVDEVGVAVRALDIAIDELESALDWLDSDDSHEAVHEIAADMGLVVDQVRWEFDSGNFNDRVTELELLIDTESQS